MITKEEFDEVGAALAQMVINIDEGVGTKIEKDSRVHRALVRFCTGVLAGDIVGVVASSPVKVVGVECEVEPIEWTETRNGAHRATVRNASFEILDDERLWKTSVTLDGEQLYTGPRSSRTLDGAKKAVAEWVRYHTTQPIDGPPRFI